MRYFLVVVVALQCANFASADTLPLTGKDVVLMLRMGYSSDEIVRDLSIKHFVGPLDADSETQIRDLNGSETLLHALKTGQFDATEDQLARAEQQSAAAKAVAEDVTPQERTLPSAKIGRRRPANIQVEKAQPQTGRERIVDLEIGQPLDLRQFNGPNVRVVVDGTDASDVMITLFHPRRLRAVRGGNIASEDELSAAPGQTAIKVKKQNNSLVYRWGRTNLVYVDSMDAAQNHVKLAIVSE